ncbi:maltose acetyltransferase-domain-containing protein [Pseudomassariella vexata]|uniref:Maltose acetyltransferase-domain-containing protein n=1 Tax=Pseudomassariella vexata TaxID=1141098 RepID=A0A1Y2EFM6_9PEZI|nr:maltose acetyltransferase-domain-containing protein [Pseudomassariella vexata]ORY70381.1 maltose acetyltransferase-domain-containing protein [Pseudomassariella vexata]
MAKNALDREIIDLARTLQGTPWCDEYEKMISGMMYNPVHPKLLEGRHRARCLAHKFNNLDPNSEPFEQFQKTQCALLEGMVGKIGSGSFV